MSSVGPKPLTIEEYRKRQKSVNCEKEIKIPIVKKPKRRGGYTNKLKREKAILLRLINSNPPPSWASASQMWKRIEELELLIKSFIENRIKN